MLAKALEGKAEKAGSATEALRLISQVSGVARRQILSDIDYASGRKKSFLTKILKRMSNLAAY